MKPCEGSTSSSLLRRMRRRKRRSTKKRRRSRVSLLISVLVGCRFVVEGACCPVGSSCTFAHHESEFLGAPAGSPGQGKHTGGTGSGAWHPLTPSWVPSSGVPASQSACGDSKGAVFGHILFCAEYVLGDSDSHVSCGASWWRQD